MKCANIFGKLLFILLVAVGLSVFTATVIQYAKVGGDFDQDYAAAKAIRKGLSIYNEGLRQSAIEATPGGSRIENFHPPSAALFFLPLSYLDFEAAMICFNLLSLTLYLWMVLKSLSILRSRFSPLLLVGAALLWFPFHHCIGSGQSSMLISVGVFGVWLSMRSKNSGVAGALLGGVALLKFFPIFLALFFLVRRDFKALIMFTLVFGGGLLLSFFAVGGSDFYFYFSVMLGRDVREWGSFPANMSLSGLILPLLSANSYVESILDSWQLAKTVIALLSAALIFDCIKSLARMKDPRQLENGFWLASVTMLLLSPISWAHVLPLLCYPIISTFDSNTLRAPVKSSLVFATLLLSMPDVFLLQWMVKVFSPGLIPWWVFLMTRFQFTGLVIFYFRLSLIDEGEEKLQERISAGNNCTAFRI